MFSLFSSYPSLISIKILFVEVQKKYAAIVVQGSGGMSDAIAIMISKAKYNNTLPADKKGKNSKYR